MTSDRKCTHKYRRQKVTRRKRVCGYGDPNECEMYCEWLEIRNIDLIEESVILDTINPSIELNHTDPEI